MSNLPKWAAFTDDIEAIAKPPCGDCVFWKPLYIYRDTINFNAMLDNGASVNEAMKKLGTSTNVAGTRMCHHPDIMFHDFSCFIVREDNE